MKVSRTRQTSGPGGFANPRAQLAAALVAALAWTGLVVQFASDMTGGGSFAAALISELDYFTIITNILVAVAFTGLAAGVKAAQSPRLVAGLMLAIVLVGVIYHLLLAQLYHLTGLAALSNFFMHGLAPCAVPLFWLVFARKGEIRLFDPLLWGAYPIGYVIYALVRGGLTGVYPYPFIDVPKIGWAATLTNSILIACGFLVVGWALAVVDRELGRRAILQSSS